MRSELVCTYQILLLSITEDVKFLVVHLGMRVVALLNVHFDMELGLPF